MKRLFISRENPNYLFRTLGFLLGVLLLTYGFYLFTHLLENNSLELLHCVIAVIMGLFFIIYGITGRSYLR